MDRIGGQFTQFKRRFVAVLTIGLFMVGGDIHALQEQAGNEIDVMLARAVEKTDRKKESAARDIYEDVLQQEPDNYQALWNLSLLNSREGHRREVESEMMEYYLRSKELAEKCLEYHSGKESCHYVYAVAVGRIADLASPRDRVRASEEVKEHVNTALEINPDHAPSWHLLGVWHTQAANLSRAERWAANLLFGGAPEGASNDEAERCLKNAVELEPDNILYHLDLARFYREAGRFEEAIGVLEHTLQKEPAIKDDLTYLEDARALLGELR